jgi:hypothetical protein
MTYCLNCVGFLPKHDIGERVTRLQETVENFQMSSFSLRSTASRGSLRSQQPGDFPIVVAQVLMKRDPKFPNHGITVTLFHRISTKLNFFVGIHVIGVFSCTTLTFFVEDHLRPLDDRGTEHNSESSTRAVVCWVLKSHWVLLLATSRTQSPTLYCAMPRFYAYGLRAVVDLLTIDGWWIGLRMYVFWMRACSANAAHLQLFNLPQGMGDSQVSSVLSDSLDPKGPAAVAGLCAGDQILVRHPCVVT